ncbi:MAG TPA: hypothetical protein VFB79_14145 [Candidatus Angelobacter sp.]|nr:hypothetical protein [Candidatus Angelobacter sp.]
MRPLATTKLIVAMLLRGAQSTIAVCLLDTPDLAGNFIERFIPTHRYKASTILRMSGAFRRSGCSSCM